MNTSQKLSASQKGLPVRQAGFAPMIIILGIVLLLGIAGGAYYFGRSQTTKPQITQPTITPSSSPDETAKDQGIVFMDNFGGKIQVVFPGSEKYKIQDPYNKNLYFLDGGTQTQYVEFHPTSENYFSKALFKKDSDNDSAATGCMLKDKKYLLGNAQVQEIFCYYNTIGTTSSGAYFPGTSEKTNTMCVAQVKNGVVVFDAVSAVGSDYCQSLIGGSLKNLQIVEN